MRTRVPVLGEIGHVRDAIALVDREGRTSLRATFDDETGRHAFPRNLWFRGVRRTAHDLTASALRDQARQLEETEVAQEARRFLPHQELGDLPDAEVLAVLQHHGCPTRLLDWSESLLLALWFALVEEIGNTEPSSESDGALYVFAPLRLNALASVQRYPGRVIHRETSPDVTYRAAMAFETSAAAWRTRAGCEAPAASLRMPVAFTCRLRTPRIHGQQGVFTIAGGKRYTRAELADRQNLRGDDRLPEPLPMPLEDEDGDPILARVVIPRGKKKSLLTQLLDLGIDPLRITPGIEGAMANAVARRRAAHGRRR